jgi:cellulose synthase/poly-beta-1,6-N-acetylglucosamine synthase-like glycosyltransferase
MNPIFNTIVYVVWFFATYFSVVFTLSMVIGRDELYNKKMPPGRKPKISLIVPCYEEEGKVAQTISSLKQVRYDDIEFIMVNDGSRDRTSSIIRQNIKGDKRFIFIDREENKGKSASLNEGISIANGEYIACMDGDSVIEKDIFSKVLPYFIDPKTGAVTVSVHVLRPKKFLDKLIELEYIIGLSLFLKICSFFNTVYVTPGPFSIYRKSLLKKIGGFDVNNITEDLEIAYRIHKAGYKIDNCMEARVYTILPPTFKKIYVQRRRWYSGAILTMLEHRSMLFKRKHGVFSFMIPYNYFLIAIGLLLFMMSVFLSLKKSINDILQFQYTDLDFWNRITDWKFDILNYSTVSLVGWSAFILSFVVLLIGLRLANKSIKRRKVAILAFPLMYFLYQIFWIGSVIAVLKGKKVRWR